MTIFLTTHYLDEADSMAERVMIMDAGKIIADDTPERLKANLGGDTLDLRFAAPREAQSAAALAGNVPGARDVAVNDNSLSFVAAGGEALLPRFIREASAAGIDVASANVRRPTLDNVFLSLTGRSLREQAAA